MSTSLFCLAIQNSTLPPEGAPRGLVPLNAAKTPDQPESESGVETISQVDHPQKYKVLILNDDYTPMDFVVLVLKRYFAKQEEEANQIMLEVHKKGAGIAGVYTLEIAEMRVMQANQFARLNQHPLKTTLEPE